MNEFAWIGWVVPPVLALLVLLGGGRYFAGKIDSTVEGLKAADTQLAAALAKAVDGIIAELREVKTQKEGHAHRITQIEALVAVGRIAEKLDVLSRIESDMKNLMRELNQNARVLDRHLRDDRMSHDMLSDRVNELSNEVQVLLMAADKQERAELLKDREKRNRETAERYKRGGSSSDDIEATFGNKG